MKVLHVYRTYYPDPTGGLQEAIRQICFSTRSFGIENTVFTLSPHPLPQLINATEADVVRSRSWAAPASCDIGGISAFARFRRLAEEVDILHYYFPWPFADLLHMLVCPEKPAVLTYISDVVRQRWLGTLYRPLMWKTLKSMNAIISNAPSYARTSPILSSTALRDRVRVIPLGINEDIYPRNTDDAVFNRLGINKDEPFFLFIGVLRYYKGLHVLLEAAANVNAKVVIAGTGPEGPSLRRQAQRLNYSNVIFAGYISDQEKASLLKSCRALVLSSHQRSEAFGMVLVEASMFSRPMISCEIGTGTSYVNIDKKTGFVVPPENQTALALAMNTLLENEDLADEYGSAARGRYEQVFSGAALGEAYSSLFREVAGNGINNVANKTE